MIFVLKKTKAFAVLVFVFLLCSVVLPHGVRNVFQSGKRQIPIYNVQREDDGISLTFNCAWGDEDIDEIITTLAKYKVKATFFLVGEWAEKYPQSAKALSDAGHELGGHSYDHKDYTKLSEKELKEDISKTIDAISKSTGVEIKLFRVPSGAYDDKSVKAIESFGLIPVQWSVDSIDYGDADCEGIFRRVTDKAGSGDIILMHTGTANTKVALPRILDSLGGKYTFSTVSQLLPKEEFYVDNAGKVIKK